MFFRAVVRASTSRARILPPYVSQARPLSTTLPRRAAATAPGSAVESQRTQLLSSPSLQVLEEEELDVELIPEAEIHVGITERAAQQLRTIAEKEKNDKAALRVSVESGGCHGYQYKLGLATHSQPDDYHFAHPTLKPSNIVVDAVSMALLNGSTIDFATELIGSTFRVLDNPQSQGNGCGCGVSWELKT